MKRTSKQIRLGKHILIIFVSYDFGGTLSPNKLLSCHHCGSICNRVVKDLKGGQQLSYQLLVEALGRIQGNLKLAIGEDWKPHGSPSWKLCHELLTPLTSDNTKSLFRYLPRLRAPENVPPGCLCPRGNRFVQAGWDAQNSPWRQLGCDIYKAARQLPTM